MYEAITAGDKDFTALITKMKEAGVDLIYHGGYHTEAGLIVRQAREQGFNAKLMSGDALVDKQYWEITGPTGEGTMMTFAPDPRKLPAAADVVAEFKAEGYDPEGYTLYTYAAIQAYRRRRRQGGLDRPRGGGQGAGGGQLRDRAGRAGFNEKGDVEESRVRHVRLEGRPVRRALSRTATVCDEEPGLGPGSLWAASSTFRDPSCRCCSRATASAIPTSGPSSSRPGAPSCRSSTASPSIRTS